MAKLVEVTELKKRYKTKPGYAVDGISFTVYEGEIIGILGPNGAGKSTLIKLILGVIKPTEGKSLLFGKNSLKIDKNEKKKIGLFLGGKSSLIYHLPVMESLKLIKSIYKIPNDIFEENLSKYSSILKCEEYLNQRVATLSLGQKLRIEILSMLIYNPQLIILDEPTLGLDIEGKRQFRGILRELVSGNNISVIITTHDVDDVEKLCSRILMISDGKKVMDITSSQFSKVLNQYEVVITDCSLDIDSLEILLIEKEGDLYRYLVEIDRVEAVMAECNRLGNYRYIRRELPRLEDILYEYYR